MQVNGAFYSIENSRVININKYVYIYELVPGLLAGRRGCWELFMGRQGDSRSAQLRTADHPNLRTTGRTTGMERLRTERTERESHMKVKIERVTWR